MSISLQEEDSIISNLKQSFSINNMVLFVGVGATEADFSEEICNLPWSCIVTTKRDEGFRNYFSNSSRRPKEYCSASELPPKLFNRSALPIVRLFGLETDENIDEDFEIIRERIEDECKSILSAIMGKLDVISQMIMIGYKPSDEHELRRTSLVVRWEKCQGGNITIFGIDSSSMEDNKLRKSAGERNFQCYEQSLAQMLNRQTLDEYKSEEHDYEYIPEENLFYKGGKPATITTSSLLRYRNVGKLLTEEKIYEIRPFGRIQQSRWYSNFLTRSAVYGPQWYGYLPQSEFYLKRKFEDILVNLVCNILDGKEEASYGYSTPVILNGDPGSSKSIVLGALAYRIFTKKENPIIFINKKELDLGADLEELDSMMQDIENAGEVDSRILVIWDGSAYQNIEGNAKKIAKQLDNKGRRFVLVCSAYRNLELEKAVTEKIQGYKYNKGGGFVKCNKGEADLFYFDSCYFVNSNREIDDKERNQLIQKVKLYCPKNTTYIMQEWEKLQKTPDVGLFEYLYELITILQPPLEFGLSKEQQVVSEYVRERMDFLLKSNSGEGIYEQMNPLLQAMLDAGIEISRYKIEELEDEPDNNSNYNLDQFNNCVALFSRFKLETPVSLALHVFYSGESERVNSFYDNSNRELFKEITSSIPWIFYRENEDGEFCFYYRSTKEAEIYLKNNPIEPEKQIDLVIKMLDYYSYNYKQYGSEDPFLKISLQRLIRMIGPNSEYVPFQNQNHIEHNNLIKYLDRVIDKLTELREEVGIEDKDASFAAIEVTFLREHYSSNNWCRINDVNVSNLGAIKRWEAYPDIFTEKSYYERLLNLRKAVILANVSINRLEQADVDKYEKRRIISQINSLTVELCKCNMSLEETWKEYLELCESNHREPEISWKSIESLPYYPMYCMLVKSLNSDPLNGYSYNALFSLFEKEYNNAKIEEKRIELLSGIRMYAEDALTYDIQDRGSAGIDELGRHLAKIKQYSSANKVTIKSILDGNCAEAFENLFKTMIEQKNPAAITFVVHQELDAVGLSNLGKIDFITGRSVENILTKEQMEKCEEIRSFMSRKEYGDCIENDLHALYLLLRISWMCYNQRPLLDGVKECRLTYMNSKQWEDIRRICQFYEKRAGDNRRPIVALIHALAVVQLTESYIEANDMLESLREDSFYSTARMRVPYMVCDTKGNTKKFSGKVIAVEDNFRGFIKVDGIPQKLGNKTGIRFFLKNLSAHTMPEKNDIMSELELGIGYLGFSLYTSEGRKRLEDK